MKKTLGLAVILLAVRVVSSFAMNPTIVDSPELDGEREALLQHDLGGPVSAFADTIFFGGSGNGDGTVVQGGVWTWEADSGEPPEFFLDGDPVGSQYRDGWTLMDDTARTGPSQFGAPHWKSDGTYDFDYDATTEAGPDYPGLRPGGFAHRHSFHPHPADGIPGSPYEFGGNQDSDLGPDPLSEPGVGGSWSLWIGTNLFLNPEDCGWGQKAGYGDGWSQGIRKTYTIPQGTPPGTQYSIRFFHRYAVESGFDTCWVEISFDRRFWQQVGDAADPNGIFNDGCHLPEQCTPNGPLPSLAGGAELVDLYVHTPPQPDRDIELHVRFRIASDAYKSDNSFAGDYFYSWDLDNLVLLRNGVEDEPVATFETGMDGWQPASFEGFDFDLTTSNQPAGRFEALTNLSCPPIVDCPEACGLENRVLLFCDKDDCDLNDAFQSSYAISPPFEISAGPLRGVEGRGLQYDKYTDGGAGFFSTRYSLCWLYYPFNENHCPYSPAAGDPGSGDSYNWAQPEDLTTCHILSMGEGPDCRTIMFYDVSTYLPADADSVVLYVGAVSWCRSNPDCDINDNGAPFLDNIRFGVFDPAGTAISAITTRRFADNFPLEDPGPGQNVSQMIARADAVGNSTGGLGFERPPRWVRGDTARANTGAPDASVWLRFAVEAGPCQTNLNDPWFQEYAPTPAGSFPTALIWHEARMDTARRHGTGILPGTYMTCYHQDSPLDGTHWCGTPPSVEPCDDILSDCLFTPGTNIYYFFELREAPNGAVLGTFPRGRDFAPIGTDPIYESKWLQLNNLPEVTGDCTGEYQNNLLLVYPYPGTLATSRDRVTAVLSSLGLQFDVYDGPHIGRREDRPAQPPRPPYNGATQAMLEGYDCIWHSDGLYASPLSDRTTDSFFGGQPTQDQQTLETWLEGCTPGNNRLLILEGVGWANATDTETSYGPTFLANRGVDVLASDYAQQLAADDLRRCARLVGQGPCGGFTGEAFGSGCPDRRAIDVLGAVGTGLPIVNFVESFEGWDDPVNCGDDVNRTTWHAVVRSAAGCERSVSMGFSFAELYPLNCQDQCLFDDWVVNGTNAELVIDIFQWAEKPINSSPVAIEDQAGAPRFVNELYQAEPNPANPSARIRYTIAEKGFVSLKIFDVGGRQVKTLVNEVQEPTTEGFAVVWNGTADTGKRVSSGVFFYQIDTPGFTSAKKLVILR